jgi:hypothetical protein
LRVDPPFKGAFQLSTIRIVDDVDAEERGGRPGSDVEIFANQTDLYHQAGGF